MAAYGLVQLEKLSEFNRRRQHNFAMLDDVMKAHEGKVVRPRTTEGAETTWMRYPFLLGEGVDRNELQERFLAKGIATRMVWTGNILRQPGFAAIDRRAPEAGFPNADIVMDRAITLPLHHALTSDDVGYLCESADEILRDL
jgi:CDP-6-deoxy-D-xylo-4-hexulose-3-dehydrase